MGAQLVQRRVEARAVYQSGGRALMSGKRTSSGNRRLIFPEGFHP